MIRRKKKKKTFTQIVTMFGSVFSKVRIFYYIILYLQLEIIFVYFIYIMYRCLCTEVIEGTCTSCYKY